MEDEFKKLTIKNINFSKKHSRYCIGVKEENGKIVLDSADLMYMNNKFGTYQGNWRNKEIEVDKNFTLLHA